MVIAKKVLRAFPAKSLIQTIESEMKRSRFECCCDVTHPLCMEAF